MGSIQRDAHERMRDGESLDNFGEDSDESPELNVNIDQYWKTDWPNKDLDYPKADLIEFTDTPVKTICLSARGDYSSGYVYDQEYEETMKPVGDEEMSLAEKEEHLIKKCLARGHHGVTEHVQLVFGVERMSRVCMAQITRHRLLSFDVQSMRYVDMSDVDEDDFYAPPTFRSGQAKTREGVEDIDSPEDQIDIEGFFMSFDSDDPDHVDGWKVETCANWEGVYRKQVENCVETYRNMVEAGVPKEHARMILPLGTRVNCTVSMNLRSFLHLLEIRGAGDAQGEINFLVYNMACEVVDSMPRVMEIYFENVFMKPKRLAP